MKPRKPAAKYHFMLGTTSRVPKHPGWHYLILDIDGEVNQRLTRMPQFRNFILQPTQSGIHVYTNLHFPSIKQMVKFAVTLGADRTWAKLAKKRGWAFLADKREVKIPWPVERMVLGWRKPCSK